MALRRLRTRGQFQAVLGRGETVSRTAHFVLHRLRCEAVARAADAPFGFTSDGTAADGWIGVMTPKRWARRAVTRNTIRRQIHSVGDLFEERLHGAAHVVRLRAAFDRQRFPSATSEPLRQAIRGELLQLLQRLPVLSPGTVAEARTRKTTAA